MRSLSELANNQLLSFVVRKISGADDEADGGGLGFTGSAAGGGVTAAASGRDGGHGSGDTPVRKDGPSDGCTHGVSAASSDAGDILFPDMPAPTGSNGFPAKSSGGGSNYFGGSTGSTPLGSSSGSGTIDWRGSSGKASGGSGGGALGFDSPVGRSGKARKGSPSSEDGGGSTGMLHNSSLRNIFGTLQNGRRKAPSRAK